MNVVILLRLLLAHLLSDFVFQSDQVSNGKQGQTRMKYVYQLWHGSTHALIAYLFVSDWSNWIIPLVVLVSHTLMDYIKVEYMKKDAVSFIIDQLVHIITIVVLWLSLLDDNELLCHDFFIIEWNNSNILIVAMAYLLVLKPTSVFLSLFIKRWTPSVKEWKSLPSAGKCIGYLERILILTFILTENTEGLGFLLAAKSIFRFGELSKAQDIKTTEYVLIGTFASFTIAILVGFAVLQIIG